MTTLLRQNCLNHPSREASARCIGCHVFFCRECVSEHQGVMICAPCLAQQSSPTPRLQQSWLPSLLGWLTALLSLLFLWLIAFSLGRFLGTLPHSFQEQLPP
ncbi:MAG: rhomboid family protein [Blastochloris sp.]|nr:rhomboid family protein [Blastochloris sp.]